MNKKNKHILTTPSFKEDHISQIPALQVLQNLGYTYLTPEEAMALRGGRRSGVLLNGVLEAQLRKINRIHFKGQEHAFSEGNIHGAMQALRELPSDGLIPINEKIYDLLTLPKSMQQSIYGDMKSFTMRYIDWDKDNWSNNAFHVTQEFVVERTGSHETRRPDIVLFVNGIPLSVIECKRPDMKDPLDQAISQQLRNQRDEEIPKLFWYSQLLLAMSKNEAKYGTTGAPPKFWSVWKESNIDEAVREVVNRPLSEEQKGKLFSGPTRYSRKYFDELEASGREPTAQDAALYSLCRPERLLELMLRYTLFDAGEKKIARYQQYFTVRNIMERIQAIDSDGRRRGGVVWHTQGSGKSLTMVMLAEAIAMEPDIDNYKIVLVTDRVDLDEQIYKTFAHCGAEPVQAKTGAHLIQLVEGNRDRIITTIIDKFEAALGRKNARNESSNVFVLVDESHRSQYGPLHAKMRKVLPNACFIGFTGTPLVKADKNTMQRFGGLIQPTYTIRQAVEDNAVVPLLYEGRHVEQKVDREAVDEWFARITEDLSPEQTADLKKKFATTDQLNIAEQKIMRVAWDISVHFRDNWQGTPFKAQLVTQRKEAALRYKHYLDEFGMVSSEVLISGPDDREGHEDIYSENTDVVNRFWTEMMAKYRNEKEYNTQLINSFKNGDHPEIIIVVDKLLTGFDAPRNTILYLTRQMKDHTLLQAIARVNRLCEGKEFGYIIDYRGVLSALDSALDLYGALSEFDRKDLEGTLTDVSEHIKSLPQKHSDLWQTFHGVKNKRDEEEFELLLGDEELRERFYERLSAYARTLGIAMASVAFIEDTPPDKVDRYKHDLKFFMNLRTSVRRRYAEAVDFGEYERKIQKLIDAHVGTGEVEQITDLVNIFDEDSFSTEVEKVHGTAAKADTIAYRTKKTISERMREDPAFYQKFSRMLEDAIEAFRQHRISDAQYLGQVMQIRDCVRNRTGDDLPEAIRNEEVAKAFYGIVLKPLTENEVDGFDPKTMGVEASLGIDEIIRDTKIVNWTDDTDIQNQMRNRMEDFLFELAEKHGIELSYDDIDDIMELCLDIARVRYAA